mmetsp:Transcript_5182/g.10542  ORF Transcript_5182/g.10542 Transcript_5182/m.10542 type:complete len:345 (-) Transcript_5182:2002-3036(-)
MMGYFDLNDVLADEERVMVRFTVAAQGLRYLDPSAGITFRGDEKVGEEDSEEGEGSSEDDNEDEDLEADGEDGGGRVQEREREEKRKQPGGQSLKDTGDEDDIAGSGSDSWGQGSSIGRHAKRRRSSQRSHQGNAGSMQSGTLKRDAVLPQGSRVELPFWLAETLGARDFVTIELPRCFGVRVRHELQADATNVNLFQKNPYFFQLGKNLCRLVVDDTLPSTLSTAFAVRAWKSVDRAFNICSSSMKREAAVISRRPGSENRPGGEIPSASEATLASSVTRKLDNLERRIFNSALESAISYARWKDRSAMKIPPGQVTSRRKRFRAMQTPYGPGSGPYLITSLR